MMRTIAVVAAAAALCIFTGLGAWSVSFARTSTEEGQGEQAPPCRRIVSLAPSLTETLFALGLGENVVGVTRYCDYPEEAKGKPKIGGYADPSYEAILSKRPDVVFLLDLHEAANEKLRRLGLETRAFSADSVDGILAAIDGIGKICGKESAAALIHADIEETLDSLGRAAPGAERPRVLMAVGGTLGPHGGEVFAAGPGTYLDEVLRIAGGRNVLTETMVAYPRLSTESILNLRPDIILDLSAEHEHKTREEITARWSKLAATPAVAGGRVFPVDSDAATVPGPRVAVFAETVSRILARVAAGSPP